MMLQGESCQTQCCWQAQPHLEGVQLTCIPLEQTLHVQKSSTKHPLSSSVHKQNPKGAFCPLSRLKTKRVWFEMPPPHCRSGPFLGLQAKGAIIAATQECWRNQPSPRQEERPVCSISTTQPAQGHTLIPAAGPEGGAGQKSLFSPTSS